MAPDRPLLETRSLTVRYGGVVANDAVSMTCAAGRIVGLIGPNGAGKTTFIDAVAGFTASSGDVLFDGRSIAGLAPHRRARAGVTRTWQSLELFHDLTVLENVLVAARPLTVGAVLADLVRPGRRGEERAAASALEQVGLFGLADRRTSELSLGQQKLLGVARALAGDPRIVLLDEPAAGLDTGESAELGRRLRALVDEDRAMLLVDHDMGLVLEVCDEVYVLEFGRVIAHGTPAEIRADEAVVAAYLGHEAADDTAGAPEGALR